MRQYKVGDVVQIRQWDDMAKEFGITDYYGSIRCPHYYFTKGMKKYCGKKLRISIIGKSINGEYYFLNNGNSWYFTSDMFEKGTLLILITRRQECMK